MPRPRLRRQRRLSRRGAFLHLPAENAAAGESGSREPVMATVSEPMNAVEQVPRARIRALVVPREHGAWGMLLIPLLTGAWVGLLSGQHVLSLTLLIVTALTLFWLRTPLESWLGTTPMRAQTPAERRAAASLVLALAFVAVLCLAGLFWQGTNLGLL